MDTQQKNRHWRYSDARERIRLKYGDPQERPPAASRYIHHLEALVSQRPNLKVVLWVRESGRVQEWRKNLRDQEVWLRREVEALGGTVVDVFPAVVSGWDNDRSAFKLAAETVGQHGAILVAESTDRFLRSRSYSSSKNPSAQPNRTEWDAFLRDANGIEMATLLHPDTSWQAVRSHQTKRGIAAKSAKCGRPRKHPAGYFKDRRAELLERVLYFRHAWGCSYREIGAETRVPWRTVKDWLKPFERGVCGFSNVAWTSRPHAIGKSAVSP
jgi:hypothetical protein